MILMIIKVLEGTQFVFLSAVLILIVSFIIVDMYDSFPDISNSVLNKNDHHNRYSLLIIIFVLLNLLFSVRHFHKAQKIFVYNAFVLLEKSP